MINKMKKILIGVVASAMCVTGSIGAFSASAAEDIDTQVSIEYNLDTEESSRLGHGYSWSNIHSVTTLPEGFSLNTSKSVTISFCNCTSGAASVKIYKYGDANAVVSIAIPEYSIPTQYIYKSLAAGSYYITVCPATGYESTSGSIYISNIDGVTQTT